METKFRVLDFTLILFVDGTLTPYFFSQDVLHCLRTQYIKLLSNTDRMKVKTISKLERQRIHTNLEMLQNIITVFKDAHSDFEPLDDLITDLNKISKKINRVLESDLH